MLKSEAVKLLKSAGIEASEGMLEIPRQDQLGDVSFPCFELSRVQKKNPNQIASELKEKIKIPKSSAIERVEAYAGYVNFFFDWVKVADKLLKDILAKGSKYGKFDLGKGETAVVDYSSPNPIHPIHIGAARNTLLGESLCRVLEFSGYDVKRIFFVNDLGRQVVVLLWYYLKFVKDAKPDKKEDQWLLDFYIKANKELKEHPEYEVEVDDILKKCELGAKDFFPPLRKIVEWCLKGFQETYDVLGIKFDEYIWESGFVDKAKVYVTDLLKDRFAFATSDNAIVINLEPHGLPDNVILRHDGTTLYLIRDVAADLYRLKKYNPSLNIYVVAEDQNLYFRQKFKILELLGYKSFVQVSHHLSYGYVTLPEGKMASRLGRVVLLDDLIEESVKRVKEKFSVTDEKTAKAIGIGAVTYAMLKVEAKRQVLFRWDDVLSLEGNSAPYIQYAYARCCSILNKAGEFGEGTVAEDLVEHETKLLKTLVSFRDVVDQSVNEFRPDIICTYSYELAARFNAFYQVCPVISAESEEKRNFRLALVKAVKLVLGISLDLLNIEKIERV